MNQSIGLMLLATSSTAAQSAAGKWLAEAYAPVQVVFFRSLFALLVVLIWTYRLGWISTLTTSRPGAHLLRAALAIISLLLWFGALPYLPLVEAFALSFTQPLFVAALSMLFLAERVDFRRWLAVLIGFGGVLVILRPGLGTANIGAALAVIISSVLWAVALLLSRRLSFTESSTAIVFYSLLTGAITTGAAIPFVWISPSWFAWMLFVFLGVVSAYGQFTVTEAYRRAPAGIVAPFYYASLLWTSAFGYLIWGEVPDTYVMLGALLMIVGGWIAWRPAKPVRPVPPHD